MNPTRTVTASTILSKQSAAQTLKAFDGILAATSTTRPTFIVLQRQYKDSNRRQFSTSKPNHFSSSKSWRMKEFFPAPESPHINKTPAAWPHPVYTQEQMDAVVVAHRDAKTWSDYAALGMTRLFRFGLDLATGYKHDQAVALGAKDPAAAKKKYAMTERKYMIRNIFLESIAGMLVLACSSREMGS